MSEQVYRNALGAGIASCGTCLSTLALPRVSSGVSYCPICGARIRPRKPHSVQRTWALLATAVICYIPANLYPIMTVVRFGRGEPDTILSGIVHLAADGQWPIALLVFMASVIVPALKIFGLAFLLLSVQQRSRWRLQERGRLYHLIHEIGRWSMIDIFMISILVALVHLGAVASVLPGLGAAFFAVVVLATMFAAITFDERLLWDAVHE